ncbi:ribonuclease E inhibitor RraB [Actinocrinis sp.]|uniref:ribonuclease E inhibitor RraB n=1 Tax=Actinocrinis sp. TaxID=1920516 RepID=UPI002D338558|nr:ribonuclease E inhibitor RraB [Actinocrinis sp.]HZP53870.1 ribonuclease E inhibitor RraB [Actinocrinis sp.]
MTVDQIPYTHWAYFTDRPAAEACARELAARFDCLTAIDPAASGPDPWLLRAARTVDLNAPGGWHDEIEEVVQHHGGRYDGGEATMFVPPVNPSD